MPAGLANRAPPLREVQSYSLEDENNLKTRALLVLALPAFLRPPAGARVFKSWPGASALTIRSRWGPLPTFSRAPPQRVRVEQSSLPLLLTAT